MSANMDRKIILVTRKTRLEELINRFQTLAQAKFYINSLGQDFTAYTIEDETYKEAKKVVVEALNYLGRYQVIDRMYLPNFVFGPDDVVVALGQDGLIANTMKYLNNHGLIGVNPDAYRYDGVLLPFEPKDVAQILPEVLLEQRQYKSISMAMASLNDGQTMYAVNDLFIGPKSHVSARYEIKYRENAELQSSSGIIVSTGLGSTGWMKSIYTGAIAIHEGITADEQPRSNYQSLDWDSEALMFAVREPFPSLSSSASLVSGYVARDKPLSIASRMAENGVIFSDGIEADYIDFNAGSVANIQVADRQGKLII